MKAERAGGVKGSLAATGTGELVLGGPRSGKWWVGRRRLGRRAGNAGAWSEGSPGLSPALDRDTPIKMWSGQQVPFANTHTHCSDPQDNHHKDLRTFHHLRFIVHLKGRHFIVPVLQVRKPRLREGTRLAPGHTALNGRGKTLITSLRDEVTFRFLAFPQETFATTFCTWAPV